MAGGLWLPDAFGPAAANATTPPGAAGGATDPNPPSAGDDGMAEDGRPGWKPTSSTRQEAAPRIGAVATTTNVPATSPTKVPAPPIISRASWGADETIRQNERQYAPLRKMIVHHTASDNRPANPAAVVRETYRYHVQGRGFSDIGYNYMVDHTGRIYEGRFARRYGNEPISCEDQKGWGVVGAHAAHYNHGSCGVCLIGNFELGSPTDAALTSLTWLLAWKAGRNQIDLGGDDAYENFYSRYFQFPNLSGHRNVGFTLCPGRLLYAQIPSVRKAAAKQAGTFPPLVVNIPAVVRTEYGNGRGPTTTEAGSTTSSTSTTSTSSSTTTPATTTAPATSTTKPPTASTSTSSTSTTSSSTSTTTVAGATGSKATGYRAVTSGGLLLNTPNATGYGKPGAAVVGLAAPGAGDGYAAVAASGKVFAFGGVAASGDASGKGTAVDIATTRTGQGYWVVMADGAIYPFGDARYFGSPKRNGLAVVATAIEARPGSDGYWVLCADGAVRGYGAARSFGTATGTGTAVDLAVTPTGKGCFVLFDSGGVAVFGDAVAAGDLTTTKAKWTKPAAAITALPASNGYVISARDGGLFSFGGAPFFGSFAGSGATVVGLAVACT